MKRVPWLAGPLALALTALVPAPAAAQQKPEQRTEPLVDKVRKAIDAGVKYLRQNQHNGAWNDKLGAFSHPGGATCLALLALLNCGVEPTDPVITAGLKRIRDIDNPTTYVRSLQTMVYAEAGFVEDLGRIQKNVDHFLKRRIPAEGPLQGWSYDYPGNPNVRADNSNTQFVVLALYMARVAGAKIDRQLWEAVREFYTRTQGEDGGWSYAPTDRGPFGGGGSTLTMTTAGLSGLLISGMELNPDREKLLDDGTARGCGVYDEDRAIKGGLGWISSPLADRFKLDLPQRTFYNIYGIERVGRLSGQRFIGPHDWYREGCLWLVNRMKKDERGGGYWKEGGTWDSWEIVSTSFALLFLSKGRTPILISKLAHGDIGARHTNDLDWNNDRNDLRHLVDFVVKGPEPVFPKSMPLAWQNFDMQRAALTEAGVQVPTEDHLLDVISDMLQTPIVYITGHKDPSQRFTASEVKMLKQYVENGGFILAEACCGSEAFDRGFKKLVAELFPDNKLDPLPPDHPVWTSHFKVAPDKNLGLYRIEEGCKTVLIYSAKDLSCRWESGKPEAPQAVTAFRLGANIVAYATGKEPPRPRLTRVDVARGKDDARKTERGFMTVGQLRHGGDWKPAPRAMQKLMTHLREHAGLDVILKTEELQVHFETVKDFRFIYMHGRREFEFKDDELKELKFTLENGGLLFADACCGKEAFDKSFRRFAEQLFPGKKLEPVPADDLLFSQELNRVEALTAKNIRCRTERGKPYREMAPALEGIRVDGRWAVLYSRYDIGCALERHASSDCLGYDHDSALRIAGAATLYTLRP